MNIYAVELHGVPVKGHAYENGVKLLRFNIFFKLPSDENIAQFACSEIERRGCQRSASHQTFVYHQVEDRHIAGYDHLYSNLYQEALEKGCAVIALDDTPTQDESGEPRLIAVGPLTPIDH